MKTLSFLIQGTVLTGERDTSIAILVLHFKGFLYSCMLKVINCSCDILLLMNNVLLKNTASVVQRQTPVTAYLESKQLLVVVFADQNN